MVLKHGRRISSTLWAYLQAMGSAFRAAQASVCVCVCASASYMVAQPRFVPGFAKVLVDILELTIYILFNLLYATQIGLLRNPFVMRPINCLGPSYSSFAQLLRSIYSYIIYSSI